jgi:hypothetical protein
MLFGVQGGANPRHTEVMTISECVEQVVALMKGDWPDISAHYVTEMLARPIWPVEVTPALCSPLKKAAGDESRAMDATRLQMAQALGLARTGVDGKVYAPIIYANPNFHLHEEGSQPYKILSAPFAQLLARLNHDHTQVSSQDDWMLAALVEVMTEVFKNAPHARKGPVIKEGDLMVFNNRVLLHSGGGPEHLELPKHLREDSSRQPRIINTLDVHTNPSPYPVQPGDRVTKPIRVGIVDQRAVTIDPTSFH